MIKEPKTVKQQHPSCVDVDPEKEEEARVVNLPQQLQETSETPQDVTIAGLEESDLTVGSAQREKINYLTRSIYNVLLEKV